MNPSVRFSAGTVAAPRRLGKNHGAYRGETISIGAVLEAISTAAASHGWSRDILRTASGLDLPTFVRQAQTGASHPISVYISAGIHGDEPAGPLAILRLLEANAWPAGLNLWVCPCLNPTGFMTNRRGNASGLDLNRQYLRPAAEEIVAHTAWLERQARFDLCLCLHEDWEASGFYLYELNPDNLPSLAETIIERVRTVCPIDGSEVIEDRPAVGGIIRPSGDPRARTEWPEAVFLLMHKTRLSYTLEAPSDFALMTRVDALSVGVNAALEGVVRARES